MQPTLAFYIVGSFVFLALMGFSLISVYERRFKAVILVAIFAFVFEAFWFFLGFQFPEASNMITVVFAGSSAIILVLVSMPVTKPKSLKINVQNAGRIDERDIVFARDRLVPDTVQYNEYYNNLHPEFKKIDDKIRKMPFPGEPGGKLFDDIKTQYANASFDLVDDIRHLAMPALPEDSSKIVRSAQEFAKII